MRNSTPNQIGIDAELRHDRHEDRERDQHHADLVDEDAEEDQEQHHQPTTTAKVDKALAEDGRDQPVGGAGEAQDLRERGGAQDDEQDHAGDGRGALERFHQRLEAAARDRARATAMRRQRAERRRLGRCRKAAGHGADHDGEDRRPAARRRARAGASSPSREWAAIGVGGASSGVSCAAHDDVGDEGDADRIRPGTTPPISSLRSRCPTGCRAARSAPTAGSACRRRRWP